MFEFSLLASVFASAVAGSALGFLAGLVPGLHMNNVAAAITAYGSVALTLFARLAIGDISYSVGILVSCFISAALVSHIFSESVVSTYVGIPDEDVVSVLPAHRLAKAGLGALAVRSSVDGALAGVIYGVVLIFPVCALMGSPCFAYDLIGKLMPAAISIFILMLIASEGYPSLRHRRHVPRHVSKMLCAFDVFLAGGLLGTAVLLTNFYAAPLPDFPWMPVGFVPRSSLLLPMFAGFFGVPSLLLSMNSRPVSGLALAGKVSDSCRLTVRETITTVLGGIMVGWLPGMTSGSATTVCSPSASESPAAEDISSAVRFIWLYSAISASGAVMSVGALFVIQRARSGSMDAVSLFVGGSLGEEAWTESIPLMSAILLAMVISCLLSHWAVRRFLPILSRSSKVLCSRALAVSSLLFVTGLCLSLTGVRGALVMAASTSLGLLPPVIGVRRIQLMGSLLVPIWILFVTML